MVPKFPDDRLNELAAAFEDGAKEIGSLYRKILLASIAIKFRLYRLLISKVDSLRRLSRLWATTRLVEFFSEEDRRLLPPGGKPLSLSGTAPIVLVFLDSVDKALLSVSTTGGRFLRSSDPYEFVERDSRAKATRRIARGTSPEVARASAVADLADSLETAPITIIGRAGKPTKFTLDYYVSIAAAAAMTTLKAEAAKSRAIADGMDLVRVSENFSIIGDYCDGLRGRVFSVSGSHKHFPPLAETPNGGPPFHIGCFHTLSPISEREALLNGFPLVDAGLMGKGLKEVNRYWRDKRSGK